MRRNPFTTILIPIKEFNNQENIGGPRLLEREERQLD